MNANTEVPVQVVMPDMNAGQSMQNENVNSSAAQSTSVMHSTMTQSPLQQQMQAMQQNLNSNSAGSVQMFTSDLNTQVQMVSNENIAHSGSSTQSTLMHPTVTMAQAPMQHVQVIPQALSNPYFQSVYSPQQQVIFPGNLTLHTGTAPMVQSIAQNPNVQLQAKPELLNKVSVTGPTYQIVNAVTTKGYPTQNLITKPMYSSVNSATQVSNANQLKQITSQPQMITTQASSIYQPQIFGPFTQLPQNITWATPGTYQSPTLLSANVIIRNQQPEMYIQPSPQTTMLMPVASGTAQLPSGFTYALVQPQKPQQLTQKHLTIPQTQLHKAVKVRNISPSVATQTNTNEKMKIPIPRTRVPQHIIRPKGRMTAPLQYNAALSSILHQQIATDAQNQVQLGFHLDSTNNLDSTNHQVLPNLTKTTASTETESAILQNQLIGSEVNQSMQHLSIKPEVTSSVASVAQITTPTNVSQVTTSTNISQTAASTNVTQIAASTNVTQIAAPVNVSQITAPVNVTQVATPTNVTQFTTPTNVTQFTTPTNVTQFATPTNVTQISAPATPTSVTQITTPINITQITTPTNGTQITNTAVSKPVAMVIASTINATLSANSMVSSPNFSTPVSISGISTEETTHVPPSTPVSSSLSNDANVSEIISNSIPLSETNDTNENNINNDCSVTDVCTCEQETTDNLASNVKTSDQTSITFRPEATAKSNELKTKDIQMSQSEVSANELKTMNTSKFQTSCSGQLTIASVTKTPTNGKKNLDNLRLETHMNKNDPHLNNKKLTTNISSPVKQPKVNILQSDVLVPETNVSNCVQEKDESSKEKIKYNLDIVIKEEPVDSSPAKVENEINFKAVVQKEVIVNQADSSVSNQNGSGKHQSNNQHNIHAEPVKCDLSSVFTVESNVISQTDVKSKTVEPEISCKAVVEKMSVENQDKTSKILENETEKPKIDLKVSENTPVEQHCISKEMKEKECHGHFLKNLGNEFIEQEMHSDEQSDNVLQKALSSSRTIGKHKQRLKAVVRPHILTHVIDGFVIYESSEPFPVNKSALMSDSESESCEPIISKLDDNSKKHKSSKHLSVKNPDEPTKPDDINKPNEPTKTDFPKKRSDRIKLMETQKQLDLKKSEPKKSNDSKKAPEPKTPTEKKVPFDVKKAFEPKKLDDPKKIDEPNMINDTVSPSDKMPNQAALENVPKTPGRRGRKRKELRNRRGRKKLIPDSLLNNSSIEIIVIDEDNGLESDAIENESSPALEINPVQTACKGEIHISPVHVKSPAPSNSDIKSPEQIKSPIQVKSPIPVKTPVQVKSPVRIQSPLQIQNSLQIQSPLHIKSPVQVKSPLQVSEKMPVEANVIEKTKDTEIDKNKSFSEKLPTEWSIEDVCDFVRNLPTFQDYADEFKREEIDGKALLLLKVDHIVNFTNMKFGPALKLISIIDDMKEKYSLEV